LESQAEICTADIRRTESAKPDAERERPAKEAGGRWNPILVYERESSAYDIQGVSVTVRGQSKLIGEGEPQGETRQAPEPPDTPQGTWSRKAEEMKAEMVCDASREKFTYQHLYN
jgi:hypothetical protein